MPHVIQMGSGGVQLKDQELEIPQVCTQGGFETINLNKEIETISIVNNSKVRFQRKEDGLPIQLWLNISKDPNVKNDQKGQFLEENWWSL